MNQANFSQKESQLLLIHSKYKFQTIMLIKNLTVISRKESPAFKYISDGSGRDSYVLINSGGLHSPSVYGAHKNLFQNTLRNSPRI